MNNIKKKYYNQYTIEQVKEKCMDYGLFVLDDEYVNCKKKLTCVNSDGYYIYSTLDTILSKKSNSGFFHKSNPYTIKNINNFAKINNIGSFCVSDTYVSTKLPLEFQCVCGNHFYTSLDTFKSFSKNKCDVCTGFHGNLTYKQIKNNLELHGYYLDLPENLYNGITTSNLKCHDDLGYKYNVIYDSVMRNKKMDAFNKSNPFSIDNINQYLSNHNCEFTCISDEYIDSRNPLVFICNRCQKHIINKWCNVNRNTKKCINHLSCPNCDGRTESIHALVLKQMFLYNYPDTIVEEKSCRNPKTNKIMPTDIVNHRLKIAIEIQSQWHDFHDIIEKGKIKKQFWIDKGYSFYDPDIRDYSVIEMCQIFFNIDELPDYIDYNYSNKMNIKKVQELLNSGMSVPQVAKQLNIKTHNIYDGISDKKITYPQNYKRADWTPVVQLSLNWEYIKEYDSIKQAADFNNLNPGNISSALNHNRNYSQGFNWMRKKDYYK